MKKIICILSLIILAVNVMACPVCERNQPKALRGIVHGSGPDSQWDYISVWVTIAIAMITLFFTIKYLWRPGEKNKEHIKYSILN